MPEQDSELTSRILLPARNRTPSPPARPTRFQPKQPDREPRSKRTAFPAQLQLQAEVYHTHHVLEIAFAVYSKSHSPTLRFKNDRFGSVAMLGSVSETSRMVEVTGMVFTDLWPVAAWATADRPGFSLPPT